MNQEVDAEEAPWSALAVFRSVIDARNSGLPTRSNGPDVTDGNSGQGIFSCPIRPVLSSRQAHLLTADSRNWDRLIVFCMIHLLLHIV